MTAPVVAVEETLPGLIGELLREQGTLSAVERFAERDVESAAPKSGQYEDLIPVGRTPGQGQQLAFRVDLDRCTGCKACVTACHNLNGLGVSEVWRDVGLVVSDGADSAHQQTITTTCHHCEDPACLNGCPVLAYEKDPVTGIVRHLDDQCIGCQYCVLKCPYDVPKYSRELGIVRKCDMCAGRLSEGEAPACVQACPTSAISITIVDTGATGDVPELVPGLGSRQPPSHYTRPTTRYVTKRFIRGLRAGNDAVVEPADSHTPLAVMLLLMQLSVGLLAFDLLLAAVVDAGVSQPPRRILAALAAALGIGAATLHLGRPLYAYRAFLGWRRSWMSREILAFGVYVPMVLGLALASITGGLETLHRGARALVEVGTLSVGLLGALCSVMIYVDTRRERWELSRTAPDFVTGAVLLGGSSAAASLAASSALAGSPLTGIIPLALLTAAASALRVRGGWRLAPPELARDSELGRSERLLTTHLFTRFSWRIHVAGCACAASVLAALAVMLDWPYAASAATAATGLAFVMVLAGELFERHLFFAAEASRSMPGH